MTGGRPAGAVRGRLVAIVAVLLTLPILAAAPAGAVDHSKGTPGFCPTDQGVTVVIDFQQLGGDTLVRCSPSAAGTGLDAMKGAGFQMEGTRRWGEAFVCRIENRPAATEAIPIQGNSGYQERCLDTPPATGHWSYWHAGNGCAWEHSQWGIKNRSAIPGGFEGWSFSLNGSADDNPEPRIAAVRPGTEGTPCSTDPAPPPRTADPNEQQQPVPATSPSPNPSPNPDQSPSPSPGAAAAGDATTTTTGPASPTTAPDPSGDVDFSGGERAADVRDVLREESGSAPSAPWAAVVVMAALGAGMYLHGRRRERAREA